MADYKEEVLIIGAGGHALSVLDILAEQYKVAAFLDRTAGEPIYGVPVESEDRLLDYRRQGIGKAFVAIGDNRLRAGLIHKMLDAGFQMVNAVSKHSYISRYAELGAGIAVMPGASIGIAVRVADGAIINTGASVDHECDIGKYVHIAPGSSICGKVEIGGYSFICVGSKIKDGVKIGNGCIIAAGAVVLKDVLDGVTVGGIPARRIV